MLLRSKVRIPPSGQAVKRTQLLARLGASSSCNIVSLVAPAGFGKTALLAQWVSTEPDIPVAWVSLEGSDGEARQFLAYLVYALELAGVDMGPFATGGLALEPDSDTRELLYALVGQLEGISSLNIVLDDYHRAQSDELNTLLLFLLRNLSPDIRLFVASRYATDLPLAEFHLSGRLADFTECDLRFSPEETAALFCRELEPQALLRLQEQSGGWPAALQLTRLALRELPAADQDLLAAAEPELSAYLSQQVMSDLDTEEQAFFLETSMLDFFDAGLADYVRGREDSFHLLRRLARLRPLLQLDKGRYSYHILLKKYLLQRFRETQPQRFSALCARATDWLAGEGQLNRALEVTSIAGDYHRALGLIQQAGGWHTLLRFGPELLQAVLPHFSEKMILEFEELQVCRFFLLIKDGQLTEARRRVDDLRASSRRLDSGVSVDVLDVVLDMYSDAPIAEDSLAQTSRLIDELPAVGAQELHAVLRTARLRLLMGLGRIEEARLSVIDSMQYLRQTELLYAFNFFYYHLGFLQVLCCDIDAAQQNYHEGIGLAREHFSGRYCLSSVGEVLLSETHYLRNELDSAGDLLEGALEDVSVHDGWCEMYICAFTSATRLAFVNSGLDAALDVVVDCGTVATERRLPRLEATAILLRAEVLSQQGMLENAERALFDELERGLPEGWRHEPHFWYVQHLELMVRIRIAVSRRQWTQCHHLLDVSQPATNRLHALERSLWTAGLLAAQGRQTEAVALAGPLIDTLVHRKLSRLVLDIGPCLLPVFVALLQQPAMREVHCREFVAMVVRELGGDPESALSEEPLSEREYQVLRLLEQGLPNKLIAAQLGTSENTVKFHLKNLFRKMTVTTRAAAIHTAREIGLLS